MILVFVILVKLDLWCDDIDIVMFSFKLLDVLLIVFVILYLKYENF